MNFKYNNDKNEELISKRRKGFEEIIDAIGEGGILRITDHHNQAKYSHQKILHIQIGEQVYCVPFVIDVDGNFFLKTAYPSRKAKKLTLD